MTDKENTTDPVLSSPTRPPSIWTNRFLRADMPQQESPSLIPIDNDEDDVLMNESAPGSIFGSSKLCSISHAMGTKLTRVIHKGIRPSTIRRTPAPPAVPSTLRKEWTQSPSTTSTPSRFQSTLAYLGLSPKNSPSGSPNLNSPRVRRSARLRFKTPLRREVSEETEVVYEYRGDTLSGGRDLMPEFFGEHEIVQGDSLRVFFLHEYLYEMNRTRMDIPTLGKIKLILGFPIFNLSTLFLAPLTHSHHWMGIIHGLGIRNDSFPCPPNWIHWSKSRYIGC